MCIPLITLAMLCGRIDLKEEENRINFLIDGREEYVTSCELVLGSKHFPNDSVLPYTTLCYSVLLSVALHSAMTNMAIDCGA